MLKTAIVYKARGDPPLLEKRKVPVVKQLFGDALSGELFVWKTVDFSEWEKYAPLKQAMRLTDVMS